MSSLPRPERRAHSLAELTPLLRELADLKRLRAAHLPRSVACDLFERGWLALAAGVPTLDVARVITAEAVAAARLGAIDAAVLRAAGLEEGVLIGILGRSFDEVSSALAPSLAGALRSALGQTLDRAERAPRFLDLLARQPRAGATKRGQPRLVLDPLENHAEHSVMVAVSGVLVSAEYGADPAEVFLAGMSHHLHNALLPDAGFAGEELLGRDLVALCETSRRQALIELPPSLAGSVERLLLEVLKAETPTARAFHAADVIDRVLQQAWHARAASFTLEHAMNEMDIVHAGPIQSFHREVLSSIGLLP